MPLPDVIHSFIAQIGSHWDRSVNAACEEYFESCHATAPEPPDLIYALQKNVKYGKHERHRLNVSKERQTQLRQANACRCTGHKA